MTTTKDVFDAIETELAYQQRIWGESGANGDGILSIGERILLVEEYVAKARLSWSQESVPEIGALEIMRKIAGIATRCMIDHGAIPRD